MEKNFIVIRSFILSAIAAVVFIAVSTIIGELNPIFKGWLKDVFYHHWTGKGIIVAGIFVAGGFLCWLWCRLRRNVVSAGQTAFWLWILFVISVAGFLAIFLFYIYEFVTH